MAQKFLYEVNTPQYVFGMRIIRWGHEISFIKGIISAVKGDSFVCGKTSYTALKGRLCDTVFLNVHSSIDNKRDDTKDRFYVELEHASQELY
jgi:hypothetical protein